MMWVKKTLYKKMGKEHRRLSVYGFFVACFCGGVPLMECPILHNEHIFARRIN